MPGPTLVFAGCKGTVSKTVNGSPLPTKSGFLRPVADTHLTRKMPRVVKFRVSYEPMTSSGNKGTWTNKQHLKCQYSHEDETLLAQSCLLCNEFAEIRWRLWTTLSYECWADVKRRTYHNSIWPNEHISQYIIGEKRLQPCFNCIPNTRAAIDIKSDLPNTQKNV